MAKPKDTSAGLGTNKITVVAKQEKGRMRAGLHFTMQARTVEVTDEQLEMIEADPYLAIVPTPKEDKSAAAQ